MTPFSQSGLSKVTTRALLWGLPLAYFSVVIAFYLRTYDSAQVKITLTQMSMTALLGLWLMEKIEERRLGLSSDFYPVYAPIFAFLLSGIFSFVFQATYKWVNLDEFMRRVFYMSAALIVLDRVKSLESAERVLKFLLWGLFVSCFYGLIQYLDSRFFPPNPDIGIDIFIWRQAFGSRIFSTFGNPNFFGDYVVLMIPIVISWALAKKSFAAWCLLALALFNAIFTETKGAWIGVGMAATIWLIFYSFCIPLPIVDYLRKRLWAILAVLGALIIMVLMLSPLLNRNSIPFRLYTWVSTWEMIRAHPVAGTGIGSFKLVYSAYRRPTIIHLEGKSNTETDHAENEHIEVMFDEGIMGFGIYAWMIFVVIFLGYRALVRWRQSGKPDVRAYHLMGVMAGWLGSLIHNNFDVSIRFVSSGIFTGLLPAMAISLALSDRSWREPPPQAASHAPPGAPSGLREIVLYALKLIAGLSLCWVVFRIFTEFYEIQQKMLGSSHPGDQLMVALAWLIFLGLVGLGVYAYSHAIYKTRSLLACLIVPALSYPMYFFWGWFRADVHHNVAIVHSKQRQWNEAIHHYQEVVKRNPGFIMSYYFLGNVFNDRWDMEPKNVPAWGDPPGVHRRDSDRAIEIYEHIRHKLAPNYVQMHYHVGNLFVKLAESAIRTGEPPQKIQEHYEEAVRRYRLAQLIDPVFADTYYRLGFALSRLGRFVEAQEVFKNRILGHRYRCVDLMGVGRSAALINRDDYVGHAHLEPEAFLNLANSYLMAGDYNRAVLTYQGFLKQIDPHNEPIRNNLRLLVEHRNEIIQRIRSSAPPVTQPAAQYGIEKSVIGK